ncbi:hypothetical protein R6Q59_009949 [Mikania micrantha]
MIPKDTISGGCNIRVCTKQHECIARGVVEAGFRGEPQLVHAECPVLEGQSGLASCISVAAEGSSYRCCLRARTADQVTSRYNLLIPAVQEVLYRWSMRLSRLMVFTEVNCVDLHINTALPFTCFPSWCRQMATK